MSCPPPDDEPEEVGDSEDMEPPADPLFGDWPDDAQEPSGDAEDNPESPDEEDEPEAEDPEKEEKASGGPLSFVDRLIQEQLEKDEELILAPKRKRKKKKKKYKTKAKAGDDEEQAEAGSEADAEEIESDSETGAEAEIDAEVANEESDSADEIAEVADDGDAEEERAEAEEAESEPVEVEDDPTDSPVEEQKAEAEDAPEATAETETAEAEDVPEATAETETAEAEDVPEATAETEAAEAQDAPETPPEPEKSEDDATGSAGEEVAPSEVAETEEPSTSPPESDPEEEEPDTSIFRPLNPDETLVDFKFKRKSADPLEGPATSVEPETDALFQGPADPVASDESLSGPADPATSDESLSGPADPATSDESLSGPADPATSDESLSGPAGPVASDEFLSGPADPVATDESLSGPADPVAADEADASFLGPAQPPSSDETFSEEAKDESKEEGEPDDSELGESDQTIMVMGLPKSEPPETVEPPPSEASDTLVDDDKPKSKEEDSGNDSTDEPVDPTLESVEESLSQEVIEFLKLVKEAEGEEDTASLEPNSIGADGSAKKSFRLKEKGQDDKNSLMRKTGEAEPAKLDTSILKSQNKPKKVSDTSIGGQLRSLESALAQSTPGKLPSGIKKRSVAAIAFLSRLSGTQRAMVVVEDDQGQLQCTAAGGVEGEDYLEKTSKRLLKSVLRSGKAKMLIDATKDARFSGDPVLKEQGVKAAICAPFKDKVSDAKGLLYVDNLTEANTFSYQDLRNVESFCKKLATDTHLEEFEEVATAVTSAPEELQTEVQQIDPRIYVAVAIILVVVMLPSLFGSSSKDDDKPKGPTIVTRETADAKTVVISFLRAIETRNFRSAYQYLSPGRRKKVDYDKFNNQALKFMSAKNTSWILARLDVVEGSKGETERVYDLIPPDDRMSKWKVTTKKVEGVWYISKIKGMKGLSF